MYNDVFCSVEGKTGVGLNEHIATTAKNFVLMQNTGLSDKNGQEIYEGDIIQVRTFLGEIQGTYTVEYKLNGFNYYAPDKPEQALYFAQNLVEVIGNLYENPEVLTPMHIKD